jgi:arylsulfatase A-like enzyme
VRQISRRSFLRTVALSSAALAVSAKAQPSPKPNLLVFLPDELRSDLMVGNAAESVRAPSLHRLASESIIFERTYVTHPICSPARSSLLTGMWPHQTHCTDNKDVLPPSIRCLPEMIADSAYRTGYFGKWHLGDEFLPQHGFQEWVSIEDSFKTAHHHRRSPGQSDYTKFLLAKGFKPDMQNGKCFSLAFPTRLPFELSKPKFLEARACEFLERHRNEPFVLFVAFLEPHPPYNGPFNNEHSLDAVSLDASIENVFGEEMPLRYRLRQEYYRNQHPTAAQYREVKQKYLGLISEVDRSIGAILAKLDDLGLRERTITAVTSDHGDMMTAHGMLGKQLMFEQSATVPYFVRVPGEVPRRLAQPVSHIDFVPTMLDLLGKPAHAQCVGKSRAGLIRGETTSADFVFLQWAPTKSDLALEKSSLASKQKIKNCLRESTRALVSSDGWKLCLRDKDKNELYNLRDDPNETRNLYDDVSHRDVVSELSAQIRRWQAQVGDKLTV